MPIKEIVGISIALISAVLLICFPFYFILFIVRRFKASKFDHGALPSIITLLLFIILILPFFAIMIPNFLNFSAKARQNEAKINLSSIVTAFQIYYAEKNIWPGQESADNVFETIGWHPDGKIRYAYYCSDDVIKPENYPNGRAPYPDPGDKWPYGLRPKVDKNGFICLAIGHTDGDDFFDIWKIDQNKNHELLQDDVTDTIIFDLSKIAFPDERIDREKKKEMKELLTAIVSFTLYISMLVLLIYLIVRDAKKYKAALARSKEEKNNSQEVE